MKNLPVEKWAQGNVLAMKAGLRDVNVTLENPHLSRSQRVQKKALYVNAICRRSFKTSIHFFRDRLDNLGNA